MTGKKPLTQDEINEIMQAFIEAKRQVGEEVTFAYLLDGENTRVLIDDREETDLN